MRISDWSSDVCSSDLAGIERRVYTAGERKAILDPFRPENPDDVARIRALQDDLHAVFKQMVRDRRGQRLRAAEDKLFSGEFWAGAKSIEFGLADSEGDLRQVLRDRKNTRLNPHHKCAYRKPPYGCNKNV